MTAKPSKPMGFWRCWSFSAGVMIGSGVFLLPAVLASYGSISFLGWLLSSIGAIFVALTLARLAGRTERTGGMLVYAHDAFGDLAGFIIGWSYWAGIVFAIAAIAVAFAGYAGVLFPALQNNMIAQGAVATALVWIVALVNLRGVGTAAVVQLVMTIVKILPLLIIMALALFKGSAANIPPFNPKEMPIGEALAATSLLTMWAFLGIECGVIPAGEVVDAKRTIPRAVIFASLSVAALYIGATLAVMLLVPASELAGSEAPFSAAAAGLGPIGAPMIALGALVSAAGSANGNLFAGGQTAMAVAEDGLAPRALTHRNKGHAPYVALVVSTLLTNALLVLNYSKGLVGAFIFLISMSTLATLLPYAVSALADLKFSLKSARGWAVISLVTLAFSIVAMAGAGLATLAWGLILIVAGLPVFYATKLSKR